MGEREGGRKRKEREGEEKRKGDCNKKRAILYVGHSLQGRGGEKVGKGKEEDLNLSFTRSRLHMTLQGKLRPLQAKVTSMKASLSEYSEKLRHQEGKVKVRVGGRGGGRGRE